MNISYCFLALCIGLFVLQDSIAGSKIVFESSPDTILSSLTRSLRLRCSIQDTPELGNGAVIGRRDVSQTSDNVPTVISFIIMKNGIDIASVALSSSTRTFVNATNLKVVGGLNGKAGERGYIELIWDHPDSKETGEYFCEANAMNEVGHTVKFSKTIEIGEDAPTTLDLINYIHRLETELNHIETGLVECGDSIKWSESSLQHDAEHGDHRVVHHDITQHFQRPYQTPPQIKLGVVKFIPLNGHYTRILTDLVSVNETSLTVRCMAWTDARVYDMAVSWISAPQTS